MGGKTTDTDTTGVSTNSDADLAKADSVAEATTEKTKENNDPKSTTEHTHNWKTVAYTETMIVENANMYEVTVTTRVLDNKDTLHMVAPIFVWMLLFFVIFGVMCITDISVLVLPMILEFLCIIPVSILSIKKAKKIHQNSFRRIDIMLTARDGILYIDDKKLNVSYSERENEVYLDDMHDGGKYNHYKVTFFATISGDDVEGFLAFCRDYQVEVLDEVHETTE